MIEEDEVGFGGAGGGVDLIELASADEGCGVGSGSMLHEDSGDLGLGRAGEFLELGEREIELKVARERGLGGLRRRVLAAGGAVERRRGSGLPGRRRKSGATAGEIDRDKDGAFARCTTAPAPYGNGLGTC